MYRGRETVYTLRHERAALEDLRHLLPQIREERRVDLYSFAVLTVTACGGEYRRPSQCLWWSARRMKVINMNADQRSGQRHGISKLNGISWRPKSAVEMTRNDLEMMAKTGFKPQSNRELSPASRRLPQILPIATISREPELHARAVYHGRRERVWILTSFSNYEAHIFGYTKDLLNYSPLDISSIKNEMLLSITKYILRSMVAMYSRPSDIQRLGPYITRDNFRGLVVLILGISHRWTTNNLSLRSLTTGGVCPGDSSQEEKKSMCKKIEELEALEMELASKYGMTGFKDIDSVDVFSEAKCRAFSNDAQCIQEAKRMHELYTLRYRRATYPGEF
ncbi:hypothetical protein EDD18DRAFT_1108370 [Armillaria luteobubalina]|uniref:Uncharacterized protein n=1 Tax=Armillaria luteobubalina TaxID=153913 RepID=A0AA39PYY4_9AGAR|nr:hypothetical protein EDD18DRAFT_1108370 [Armillaria luteobubalina]